MNILEIIEEQVYLEFTGVINILLKKNRVFVGVILFQNGQIIHAKLQNLIGKNALFEIIRNENINNDLLFFIEPEIVDDSVRTIDITFEELKDNIDTNISLIPSSSSIPLQEINKLKISDEKMNIRKDFVWDGEKILANEFDILCILSDYSELTEVYKYSPYSEEETTKILDSLKQKNALEIV
ncbi:MAG: hypothetical protein HQK51_02330 [Oligoflexia bacterium]|nr:hypothetical protein [Oligoflexia bacterium]